MDKIKDLKMQENIATIGKIPPDFAKNRFIKPDTFSNNQPNNVEVKPSTDNLIKSESTVVIDPNTGMNKIVSDKYAYEGTANVGITSIDDIVLGDNIDNDENRDTLKDFGIREEDMITIFQLIREYNNGNITNMYSRLPSTFKLQCANAVCSTDRKNLNYAAKEFIKELSSQFKINKEFIDVQKSLSEEINKLDIGTAYSEYDAQRMNKLQLVADKYKEDGNMVKYQKIMDIKDPHDEAISFIRLKEAAHKIKRLDKLIKRYDQVCRDFNYKYTQNTNHNFSITDVRSIGLCLKRHLNGDMYTEDDVMKFVVLFCKLCMNYNADDIKDHVFMYFTIKQVNLLDVYLEDKQEYKDIIHNVEEIICTIRDEEYSRPLIYQNLKEKEK